MFLRSTLVGALVATAFGSAAHAASPVTVNPATHAFAADAKAAPSKPRPGFAIESPVSYGVRAELGLDGKSHVHCVEEAGPLRRHREAGKPVQPKDLAR